MKLHQNQKQILILGVMVVLGALLNAAAELLPTFGLNRFPVAYTGTILVIILCGAFPGMLAGAGALLPIYLRYLDMYGADFAKRLHPIEYTVYCALIALILGRFIRRESCRKP